MKLSRRHFLHASATLSFAGTFGFSLPAHAGSDFKALVCIYLAGGNDAINTVLAKDNEHYLQYKNVRGNLALSQSQIIPLSLKAQDNQGKPVTLGLHPAMSKLASVFNQGDANVVLNSGILCQPTTKQQILDGTAMLPEQLFSHNSQSDEWMRGAANSGINLGWAGRLLDALSCQSSVTPLYSVHGDSLWLRASEYQQVVLRKDRAVELNGLADSGLSDLYDEMLAFESESPFQRQFRRMVNHSRAVSHTLSQTLDSVPDNPMFTSSDLGKQLNTVFKLISQHQALGQSRQIYFVKQTGYDVHDTQLTQHPALLEDLSDNMYALHQALGEHQMSDSVTTFTMSDFGRRMASNGNGTDHGWGGHQIIMGKGVLSENAIGHWPTLKIDGEDDYSRGRLIPRIAADQVHGTLAKWMGVHDEQLMRYVLPNLANFPDGDLGFL
ncbi:DUF1501 domain-containing protein [Vibrio vulnificus]|nr:DUF1501 domain-containing protein [Vibrio vulnificus]